MNVVAQCFERRYVKRVGAVLQRAILRRTDEPIQAKEERRQRLARARRRRDQNILAGANLRPPLNLWLRGGRKVPFEPVGDQGMKLG